MFSRSFIFENAWWLWLLLLLPVVWWLSRRSLAGLGRWRALCAIGLRSIVMALLIFALAGMQSQKTTDSMTVIYLLDQSRSIPEAQRRAMVDYVNASIKRQRKDDKQDKGGVIVFGRDAAVELAPVDTYIPLLANTESLLDRDYTDLGGAMRRAAALFTGDTAKRIVVVSDGNENLGDALRQARSLTEAGVSIDAVAVPLPARDEISVEKVTVPADARKDQPFDLRIVLNRETSGANAKPTVRGKLRIVRKTAEREEVIDETIVELPPGKKVFSLPEKIEQADFYTYEAQFLPDDPADDGATRNNSATTFTHVRGRGHVLFIEDNANRGEFDYLISRLRAEGLEITVRPSDQAFASLPELQRYDSVVLANVPRASGGSLADVPSFSDEQIEMLISNTRLGCGLLLLGGPNSFGAGGWTGTKLEEASPVDFQIKNAKVAPVGALILMMHAGEMPKANYWQKRVSVEAIKALGYQDWCGMVQWNGVEDWLWARSQNGMLKVGPNRKTMLGRVDKMQIGDMPDFDAPMKMAVAAFKALDQSSEKPAVRHMIIISDGDANAPSNGTIAALQQLKVTVTTVSVPSHGASDAQFQQLMKSIATRTGGKFYVIRSGKALPRIYQSEVRRISRPLIKEMDPGVPPQIISQHEMIKGIGADLPPINGFVLTTVKDSPLVEVVLATPAVKPQENATILAAWTYGLGKSVAFTSDAGKRWATEWTGWEGYDRFFSQLVRWTMRPLGDTGKYSVATDVRDGKTRVVVSALDDDDAFLNNQAMAGMVIGPDMKMTEMRIEQVAPGRYVGEFDSEQAGSYSVAVMPGTKTAPILTGVNVGYSSEYRDRETNRPLLEAIAELPAKGGDAGKLIDGASAATEEELKSMLEIDPYRRDLPKASAVQDIWPWLVMLGSCIFLADVFVRRVQVSLDWLPPLAAKVRDKILRRTGPAAQEETMSRLKSRKAEVGAAIDERRAGARFEVSEEEAEKPDGVEAIRQAARAAPTKPISKPKQDLTPEEQEGESYTSRLLKAKKQVWKDRDKE